MRLILQILAVFCMSLAVLDVTAQNLNISTSGQTGTSGTNWSITGNTLNVAASGTANVHPDVISNHLNNVGDLAVVLPWQSGQVRQCNIDGTITYTGSATRILTFNIANDIFMSSANHSITATNGALNVVLRAANASGSPNNGRISIRSNSTINTNGGHLWIGGGDGNATWNGLAVGNSNARSYLDGFPGLWIENSTISTNGGNVYASALSFNSSANGGVNYGLHFVNSSITTQAGNVEIIGDVQGRFNNAAAIRMVADNTNTANMSITTTTGSISITGTGSDQTPNDNGGRDVIIIRSLSSTRNAIVSTVSGNITIDGAANYNANINGKSGITLGSRLSIVSQTGNITLKGSNSRESDGQFCNAINFDAANTSNDIRIGFDGTNAYSGDILIEGNSLLQRNQQAGSGSIAVQTTGELTIQSVGNAFTFLRTGNAGTLTFDDDWNFGTNLGGFVYGKNTNTLALTLSNALTTNGPISVYGGNITLQHNLTSTAANEAIKLIGSGSISSTTRSKTISTNGGDVLFAADRNGNGFGNITSYTHSLTIDTRTIVGGIKSTALTGGGNVVFGGQNADATGFASGIANNSAEGIRFDQGLTVLTGGGDITMRGRSFSGASLAGLGAWGLGFWDGAVTMDAGEGKIYLEGIGRIQDNVTSYKQGFVAQSGVDIRSAFVGSDAIVIKGHQISTSPNWNLGIDFGVITQNQGVGFHKIIASGEGGGITLDGLGRECGTVLRNGIDLVTNDGPITVSSAPQSDGVGGLLILVASSSQWWGSRSGQYNSMVAKDLTIRSNRYDFFNGVPNIAVAGNVLWEPFSNSFGQTVNTNFFSWNQNSQTMTGLTIGKATNTADITSGTAISTAGPISFYGGNIAVNENLNTSAGNADGDILLKASGNIIQAAGKSITTNGGDVTLWADSDGNGTGYIQLTGGSNSGISSGGGNVFLGGGTDLATGYARGAAISDVSVSPSYTVYISGVHLRNGTNINSGGGNITLRGQNTGNSNNFVQTGIMGIGTTLDAGTGKIALYGLAGGSGNANAQGISREGNGWIIRSANTEADAIYLEGDATATNNSATSLAVNFDGTIEATGAGGGVTIIGNSGTATVYGDGVNVVGNVLANSGQILITGTAPTNTPNARDVLINSATLGFKAATNVVSSSSNIIVRANRPVFASSSGVNTAGTFTLEPVASDFTNAITFPIANLTLNAAVSGLNIGKESGADGTTDRDVTLNGATSIAGPITVYGGNIQVQQNLSSTGSGSNILLKGSGRVDLSNNRTITTNGGEVTLWADADNEGDGFIRTGTNAGISTSGGNITLGGGTDITTGFAKGNPTLDKVTEPTFDLGISGVHLMSGTNLSSGGGNITLRGQNFNGTENVISFGVMGANTTVNAGAGKVAIYGNARGSGLLNAQAVSHYLNGWTIRSSNTEADAIYIDGDATATNNSASSLAVNFVGTIEATGNGSGITIVGNAGRATGSSVGVGVTGNVLAASGPIVLIGADNPNNTNARDVLINGATIGSNTGTNVTSSTSNVLIRGNRPAFNPGAAVNTSGTFTLEPLGTDFANAITFPIANLTLNPSVSGLTIGKPTNRSGVTFTSATTIAGPITIYGGTLNLNENLSSGNGSNISLFGNTLNIASGKTVTSSGGQLIISPQSAFASIGIAGALGALTLPATYFSTNFSDGFSNIQIGSNTHEGDININEFTLRDNMSFLTSGNLNLGGKPVMGENNVVIGAAVANIEMGTPTNYFRTTGAGKLFRNIPSGTEMLFPVGNTYYNPAILSNQTGLPDDLGVRVLDAMYLDGLTGELVPGPHVQVTWDIDKSQENTGAGIDFQLSWDAVQESGVIPAYNLLHHDGVMWNLAEGSSELREENGLKTLVHTGYTGTFSPFAIGEINTVLPVTLVSFEAVCQGHKVSLSWVTASEFNNDFFMVYGSTDAINWTPLERVEGYGTINTPQRYQVDLAGSAYQYFRLLQQDYDGTKEWLPVVRVDCDQAKIISAHPNPFDSSIIFSGLDANLSYSLKVYRENGQLVASYDQVHSREIATQDWQTGIYLLMLQSDRGEQSSFKLLRR